MQLILAIALFLIIGLAPVAFTGPIAALLFVSAAKKKKLSRLYLFWLVIINILLLVYIVGMLGHAGPAPGDIAVCGTPIALVVTIGILNASEKEVLQLVGDDLQQQSYYARGKSLLPIMQGIVMILAFIPWFMIE